MAADQQVFARCSQRRIQIIFFIVVEFDDRRVELDANLQQAVTLGFRKHSVFRKLWWKFPLIQSQYQTGARTLRAHTVGTAHRHLVQRVGNRADVAALRRIDKQFPQLCQRQR